MKIVDAAWLAGYIDGDGSLSLTKSSKRWRRPVISIDSADKELLLEVLRITGCGSITSKKIEAINHRQVWTWRTSGSGNIVMILKEITPFLRCDYKRLRADIMLEICALIKRNGVYTDEEIARKDFFEAQFMDTGNRRGKRHHVTISSGFRCGRG